MSRDSSIDPDAAAEILSRATGEEFRVVESLHGGETGAHRFVRANGTSCVVKWDTTEHGREFRREGVILSERLRRDAGWPVPEETFVDAEDICFVIQEFMKGSPPELIDHRLVDRLMELHTRRLGLANRGDHSRWPENLISTLTTGGVGYCRHESFRGFGERTTALIERIEEFGRSLSPDNFVSGDIVHWDLHAGNMLVVDGELSAVVDTDFVIIGDARFDLAMLALTSLAVNCQAGVRSRLFTEGIEQLDDLTAQAFLAHLFVRFIDWPIRRRSSPEVEFWLARADELLTF